MARSGIPAACCGVAGLKTTHGRISLDGVWPLAPSLDTVGPLARDVAGLVEGMRLLEPGFTTGEPGSIGRFRPAAAAGVDAALDGVLGPRQEVDLPGWDAADEACLVLLGHEAWRSSGHLLATGLVGADVADRLAAGGRRPAVEVAAAQQVRERWLREVLAVLEQVDVVALPVLRDAPVARGRRGGALPAAADPAGQPGRPARCGAAGAASGRTSRVAAAGRSPGSEEVLLATALSLG